MRRLRPDLIWRSALLAACGATAALIVVEVILRLTIYGLLPVKGTPTAEPFVDQVTSVSARTAVRAGDLVVLGKMSPPERFVWRYRDARVGERFPLPLLRNGKTIAATVVAAKATYFGRPFLDFGSWPFWLATAGYLWMTAFAMLLAWRRSDSREARLLILLLLTTVSGTVLVDWRATLPTLDNALFTLGAVLGTVTTAFLAAYAMLFEPASRLRRALAWLTYLSVAIACAIVVAGDFGLWTLTIDPAGAVLSGRLSQIAYNFLPVLFPLLCIAVTVAETRGSDRTRILWATGSLSVIYAADCIAEIGIIFFPAIDLSALYLAINIAFFLAPLGLTYALLRRRLLDVGFVLNRAAIFAAVSLIIVGLFTLFEWAVGGWLQHESHATDLAFSAVLALVLGLSVHFIHGRVEHVVDNLFFRKRHRDERALRTFAHEAAYITDIKTLLEESALMLQTYADATSVSTAVAGGEGEFGGIDENDPALVELRAWHKPVHLPDVQSKLSGEVAFPMVSRGRFMGALVLGPKRSGDSYAPDEFDAIRHVAHGIGAALDVAASRAVHQEEGFESIETLAERLAQAVAKSLPDAIAAQLRGAPVVEASGP